MEFINSMLYLLLLFAASGGNTGNENSGSNPWGANPLIFFGIILLALKDIDDDIDRNNHRGRRNDIDRFVDFDRRNFCDRGNDVVFIEEFAPRRRRAVRSVDFI